MNIFDVIRVARMWKRICSEKKVDYYKYIRSPKWKRKSDEAKARAGHRCQLCNSPDILDTHHRTYERLGHEEPGDLTVLCHKCHSEFSKKPA